MRRRSSKNSEMDLRFHLASNGWREDECAMDERLETWAVHTEDKGPVRITRWACIWYAGWLSMEERRLLHRRFGSPPVISYSYEIEPCSVSDESTRLRV